MSRPWRTRPPQAAARPRAAPRTRSPAPLLLALLALPGCQALLTEATSTGIGLGRAGLQYAQRVTHSAAQDRIAAAAGPLPVGGVGGVGGVGEWATDHRVPVEPNERGQVAVSRVISTGALECKEGQKAHRCEKRTARNENTGGIRGSGSNGPESAFQLAGRQDLLVED